MPASGRLARCAGQGLMTCLDRSPAPERPASAARRANGGRSGSRRSAGLQETADPSAGKRPKTDRRPFMFQCHRKDPDRPPFGVWADLRRANGGRSVSGRNAGEPTATASTSSRSTDSARRPLGVRAGPWTANGGRSVSGQIRGRQTAADGCPGGTPESERRPRRFRADPWTARGDRSESVQVRGRQTAAVRRRGTSSESKRRPIRVSHRFQPVGPPGGRTRVATGFNPWIRSAA